MDDQTYDQMLKRPYSIWKPQMLVFFQQISELQNETLNS